MIMKWSYLLRCQLSIVSWKIKDAKKVGLFVNCIARYHLRQWCLQCWQWYCCLHCWWWWWRWWKHFLDSGWRQQRDHGGVRLRENRWNSDSRPTSCRITFVFLSLFSCISGFCICILMSIYQSKFESKKRKFVCCGCGTLLDGIILSADIPVCRKDVKWPDQW